MRKLIYVTIVVAAAACGDGAGAGSDGGGGTGGSAGGGGSGNTGLPSTLAGTWDLMGGASAGVQGTLTLSANQLKVQLGGGTFDLQVGATPSFTWTAHDAPTFTVTHTPVDVDFGALAIGVGGDWMIGGPGGGSCVGSIRGDALTGGCAHAGSPPSPLPSLNRQVHATRTQKLDSIFGELGGAWTISDNGAGSCSAMISGATVSVSCKNGTANAGSITVTFSDGLASGFTDSGAEFSARRR
jgi:hypothetical protein